MKKILFALPLLVLLTACESNPALVTTKYKIPEVPEKFYKCDLVSLKGIDTSKLTDKVVASLLVKYRNANLTCHQSIAAIKAYLDDAKSKLEN